MWELGPPESIQNGSPSHHTYPALLPRICTLCIFNNSTSCITSCQLTKIDTGRSPFTARSHTAFNTIGRICADCAAGSRGWGPLARSHDGGVPRATIHGNALFSQIFLFMVTRRSVDESIASSIVGMCSVDAAAVGCVAHAVLEVKRALLVRALQSMDDRQAEHARHPRGGSQAPGAPAEECVRPRIAALTSCCRRGPACKPACPIWEDDWMHEDGISHVHLLPLCRHIVA